MDRKIVIGCIGIVFMLVVISFVSAATDKEDCKKESPLFRLRTSRANNEKVEGFIKKIRAENILHRIFFKIPRNVKDVVIDLQENQQEQLYSHWITCSIATCGSYFTCK